MAADKGRFEDLAEMIKSGSGEQLRNSCAEAARLWKDAPVDALLSLKEQLGRLDLEEREAQLDAALVEIAEKRIDPFTTIATQPGHPLWRAAVEVLSMAGAPDSLDLFISLLPLSPKKDLKELIRAIGCYRGDKVVKAVAPYLDTDDEGEFFEAVFALKRDGGSEAVRHLKGCLAKRRQGGSEMSTVIEAVIQEIAAA